MTHLLNEVQHLGPWAPVVFILLYVAGTLLFIPTGLFSLAAGAFFGIGVGFILISIAFLISAVGGFMAGRYWSRGWILEKAAANKKIKALDHAIGEEGWKIIFLLRVSSILPFMILNYGLGLSKARFKHFFITSWIAMTPGALFHIWMGAFFGSMIIHKGQKTLTEWILLGVGLLVNIGVSLYLVFVTKKALKNAESL